MNENEIVNSVENTQSENRTNSGKATETTGEKQQKQKAKNPNRMNPKPSNKATEDKSPNQNQGKQSQPKQNKGEKAQKSNQPKQNNAKQNDAKKNDVKQNDAKQTTGEKPQKQNQPKRNNAKQTTGEKNQNQNRVKQTPAKKNPEAPERRMSEYELRNLPVSKAQNVSSLKELPGGTPVKVIPLGGLDKIGMNITAIEYNNTIVVIDCGISFPDEDMLGIDKVIPDVSYLIENQEKVKGFVITHGHEDHIGALPYILPQLNVPVYAGKLTMGLIEHKLTEAGLMKKTKRKVIKQGNCVNLGEIRVEFIKTNHSIADASALAIYTPAGVILHTGDFKIDYSPLFGDPIDLQRLGILGKKGVLAVMCDSTNAMRQGFTPSEVKVAKTFDTLFMENDKKRIIVATFASNVDRVQQLMNTAHKYGRKVILQGRSMENVMEIAQKLEYVTIPENTLIQVDEMKNYPPHKLVFITTGSQGEAMAALSRMSDGSHRKVQIMPDDVIVFSSSPIPGNEKAVSKVINALEHKGAKVIFQDAHVSGHACEEEIKLIYSLLRPKYAIPVHGEFRHLQAGARIAADICVKKENTFVLESGDILELTEEAARVNGKVTAREIFVDGLGVGDVGNIVIRDRQNLAENGIIMIAMSLEKGSNRLLAGPDIVSRGFVYIRESGELMADMEKVVMTTLEKCENKQYRDWSKIKNEVRDSLEDYLWKKMKRRPLILPIIMEVGW